MGEGFDEFHYEKKKVDKFDIIINCKLNVEVTFWDVIKFRLLGSSVSKSIVALINNRVIK